MLERFRKKYRTLNTVRIFPSALRHNLNLYRGVLPEKAICPVLKSNAYGHGLTEVAQILQDEKLEFFIVDSLFEAYKLKKAKVKTPVLILGYTFPENLTKHLPFHFAVFDLEMAKIYAKMEAPVHLEIDTGMERTGFAWETLQETLSELKKLPLNVEGVFTHLSNADDPLDDSHTRLQLERFQKCLKLIREFGFKPKWIHVGASAGSLKIEMPEINMVRLGLALYGVSPLQKNDPKSHSLQNLEPALELSSTLVAIRTLKKGEKIGYGCTFTADREMEIGVIPLGYFEALPLAFNQHGLVEVNGQLCKPVGRICMNHTMIDLTNLEAKVGDSVVVYTIKIERGNTVSSLANKIKTIPYELLTRISESVRREIVSDSGSRFFERIADNRRGNVNTRDSLQGLKSRIPIDL